MEVLNETAMKLENGKLKDSRNGKLNNILAETWERMV